MRHAVECTPHHDFSASATRPHGELMLAKPAVRTLLAQTIALLLATATGIGAAHADGRDDEDDGDSYSIGLWGDMP